MIKLGTSKDLTGLKLKVPREVKIELQQVLESLDEAYGETRDVDKCINLGITFDNTSIPEYVLLIEPEEGEPYTQSLFLANADYSIITFIPLRLTSQYFTNMIDQ